MNAAQLREIRVMLVDGWSTPFKEAEWDVWAEQLGPLPFERAAHAIRVLIARETFRPRVIACLELLYDGPSAPQIAEEAWRAIGRFGYHSPERAKAELHPAVWDAIESYGGWMAWCTAKIDSAPRERMARIADGVARRSARDRLELGSATMVFPAIGMRVE